MLRRKSAVPPYQGCGPTGYRVCVESETPRYVAWNPWEGHILTEDPAAACPFRTRKLAHEAGKRWLHLGPVFVEKVRSW